MGLKVADVLPIQKQLAESLFQQVPAGLGSRGTITLDAAEMDAMLTGGARWMVERGWPATALAGRCRAMPRSSSGAAARLSTTWQNRASSSARLRSAALPRRRPEPTRKSAPW